MEASNVAVLLLVPEKIYMEEMFARHASKHETKEKVGHSFLTFVPLTRSFVELISLKCLNRLLF